MMDPLRNSNDPLLKAGPEAEHELFRQICRMCHGFPREVVLNVAANLQINILRQENASQKVAIEKLEEQHSRAKGLLASHYYAAGGRRNVFPFTQVIEAPLLDARKDKKAK